MQRRALGVLIEKGFTTPDQYPLTLKGATAGANQKNNRDPVTNYTEDDLQAAFNELRELGLRPGNPVHGGVPLRATDRELYLKVAWIRANPGQAVPDQVDPPEAPAG